MVPIIAHLLSSSRYAKQPSKKVFPSLRPQTPNRFLFGSDWVHETHSQVRALSEELENPMNVHRWRKLEGSDPVMYELIQKARPPVPRAGAGFPKLGKCLQHNKVFPKEKGGRHKQKKMGVARTRVGGYFLWYP